MLWSTSIAGKVAPVGERAAQPEVAVGDALHGVGDRLVEVVALDQHRVEAGDRPDRRLAGALEDLREQREDARRESLRRRRLARGEADLRCAWQRRVSESISSRTLLALVAEVLGDRCRRPWRRARAAAAARRRCRRSRRSASAPRRRALFSRNSCTSRPRSPIRAMTRDVGAGVLRDRATSASSCRRRGRRRCPCAGRGRRCAGRRCARTPVAIGSRMLSRSIGGDASSSIRRDSRQTQRALAVDRLAEAVQHAAEQLLASTRCAARRRRFRSGRRARRRPGRRSGISSVWSWRKPMTSAVDVLPPKLWMRQRLPSGSGRSLASMVMPLIACTCPTTPKRHRAVSTASSWACEKATGSQESSAPRLHSRGARAGVPRRSVELRVEVGVDLARRAVKTRQPPGASVASSMISTCSSCGHSSCRRGSASSSVVAGRMDGDAHVGGVDDQPHRLARVCLEHARVEQPCRLVTRRAIASASWTTSCIASASSAAAAASISCAAGCDAPTRCCSYCRVLCQRLLPRPASCPASKPLACPSCRPSSNPSACACSFELLAPPPAPRRAAARPAACAPATALRLLLDVRHRERLEAGRSVGRL